MTERKDEFDQFKKIFKSVAKDWKDYYKVVKKEFDKVKAEVLEEGPEVIKDRVGHQFYFVAVGRTDGTTPKLVKAFDDKMFFDEEEAQEYATKMGNKLDMPGKIKVFSAVAYIDD